MPELPVDFNNCDEDGAVRLATRGTLEFVNAHSLKFSPGDVVLMTDGELRAEGSLLWRDGMWVATITRWLI